MVRAFSSGAAEHLSLRQRGGEFASFCARKGNFSVESLLVFLIPVRGLVEIDVHFMDVTVIVDVDTDLPKLLVYVW